MKRGFDGAGTAKWEPAHDDTAVDAAEAPLLGDFAHMKAIVFECAGTHPGNSSSMKASVCAVDG
jgi:hypothetical protein